MGNLLKRFSDAFGDDAINRDFSYEEVLEENFRHQQLGE